MSNLVNKQDIEALEVYLRLVKMPMSYQVEMDLPSLMHWLDLASDNFAARLKEKCLRLTNKEMNLCCLLRMNSSLEEMSRIMHVKEETIKRTVYRACIHLNVENSKDKFASFIKEFKKDSHKGDTKI